MKDMYYEVSNNTNIEELIKIYCCRDSLAILQNFRFEASTLLCSTLTVPPLHLVFYEIRFKLLNSIVMYLPYDIKFRLSLKDSSLISPLRTSLTDLYLNKEYFQIKQFILRRRYSRRYWCINKSLYIYIFISSKSIEREGLIATIRSKSKNLQYPYKCSSTQQLQKCKSN